MLKIQPSTQQSLPWWFFPHFVLLWCVVGWTLGRLTGWTFIAKAYPHKGPIPAANHWNCCSIPNLTMRYCVNVALDEQGMYFQLWFLFRFGNPSIFVPWSDIQVSESKLFFFDMVKLTFKKTPWVNFQFYKRTANKFALKATTHWPTK